MFYARGGRQKEARCLLAPLLAADLLLAYRPVAYAMRPPGHDAAPVLCYTAWQKQGEIGCMLSVAKTSRANKAGY